MRVLLVANTLPPTDLSGVGEQVMQLASGLRAAGHEVEVLGRGRGGARGPKVLFPLTVMPAFWRAVRRWRPHVVQVHESDGAGAALLTAVLGSMSAPRPRLVALLQVSYVRERRAVRPLTFGGRMLGRPGPTERRFRWLKAPLQVTLGCLTAWLADLVLAPSETTADEIESDYRVTGVRVLPNVTGGLAWSASESGSDPPQGPYFLFVGRLRIRKGIEVLLHALARLRGYGTRLLLVGDGEHRRRVERAVAALGLEASVELVGRLSPGDVRTTLRGARALVVPSTYEGMPLVVLEAMELGVPVIASRVSGIPEVVVDGETGWIFEAEAVDELAVALRAAWLDETEAKRRGAAGLARLDGHYRPVHAVERWQALIDSTWGEGASIGGKMTPPVGD